MLDRLHINQEPSLPLRGEMEGGFEGLGSWLTANTPNYALLKENAKRMRKEPTEAESVLWQYLRKNGLGFVFRRQHIIGEYIVDFICLEKKLIIELDGKYHLEYQQQIDDATRQNLIEKRGYSFLRFSNEAILCDTEVTLQTIKEKLLSL